MKRKKKLESLVLLLIHTTYITFSERGDACVSVEHSLEVYLRTDTSANEWYIMTRFMHVKYI